MSESESEREQETLGGERMKERTKKREKEKHLASSMTLDVESLEQLRYLQRGYALHAVKMLPGLKISIASFALGLL